VSEQIEQLRDLLADVETAYRSAAEANRNAAGIAALARQRMLLVERIGELTEAAQEDASARAFDDMEAEELAEVAAEWLAEVPDPILDLILADLVRAGRAGALRRALPSLRLLGGDT